MKIFKKIEPQMVLDSIYNGLVTIDEKGTIIYFNGTAERIFNTLARDALNHYILDVLPNTGGKLLESLQTGKPFYGERLKGQTVTLIANINPIVREGKVVGATSVFQDFSEIEAISKELDLFKTMKNWLDTVLDSSYDGLFICDHEGKVVRINKAAERIDGIRREDIIGKNISGLVDKGMFDKSVTLEVIKRKTSVTMIQLVKGEKKVLVTGSPILNEKGEIVSVVCNVRDITELDHLRSQLQETQALAKHYISKVSELEMMGADLANIIFRSKEMEKIIEIASRVAKVDSSILLLGESGVGKGMIAKLIHKQSNRSQGPFIRVDCAGIPNSLMESELFGYERGSFTGAKVEGKLGLFELANKGTLFLDEVGEIPLNSQSKLLRFLEDHEIVRVGGTQPRQIDVRVIAATNRNIEELISLKLFREDLYYRLNVVPLLIPPLRERRDDILPLLFYYLEKFNKAYHKRKLFSPEAVEVFSNYRFPGNIRELANLVERLVVSIKENSIQTEDLPTALRQTALTLDPDLQVEGISLKDALKKYEKIIIEKAMGKYRSQQEIANALKMDRATISRKIKKHFSARIRAISHTSLK
jgi:PAS domain S-box-containing protein